MSFYAEAHEESPTFEFEALEDERRSSFEAQLNSPLSRIWVAEVDQQIVAVGCLTIFIRPPFAGSPSTVEAYFHDMITLPEFRRRGFASEIIAAAKAYAESLSITKIGLHATTVGRPVYESAGFQIAGV